MPLAAIAQDFDKGLAAYEAGDYATAQRMHHQLFALCANMLGLATNPIPVKAAMRMVGRDTGELRLPMTPLDEAAEAKLQQTIFAYGLASAAAVI